MHSVCLVSGSPCCALRSEATRLTGMASSYFWRTTWASSSGEAAVPGRGSAGPPARAMAPGSERSAQGLQTYLWTRCSSTTRWAGTMRTTLLAS